MLKGFTLEVTFLWIVEDKRGKVEVEQTLNKLRSRTIIKTPALSVSWVLVDQVDKDLSLTLKRIHPVWDRDGRGGGDSGNEGDGGDGGGTGDGGMTKRKSHHDSFLCLILVFTSCSFHNLHNPKVASKQPISNLSLHRLK